MHSLGPRPSFSITPGRYGSIITSTKFNKIITLNTHSKWESQYDKLNKLKIFSLHKGFHLPAVNIKFWIAFTAWGFFKSQANDFFPRLQYISEEFPSLSILITSAPKSAITIPKKGPIRINKYQQGEKSNLAQFLQIRVLLSFSKDQTSTSRNKSFNFLS